MLIGAASSALTNDQCSPYTVHYAYDTVALAKVRHPGAKLSLDALCTRYGIDRSHHSPSGGSSPHTRGARGLPGRAPICAGSIPART